MLETSANSETSPSIETKLYRPWLNGTVRMNTNYAEIGGSLVKEWKNQVIEKHLNHPERKVH